MDYLIKLHWNQAELSRRLGVHPDTVGRWHKGLPKYAVAYLELRIAAKAMERL